MVTLTRQPRPQTGQPCMLIGGVALICFCVLFLLTDRPEIESSPGLLMATLIEDEPRQLNADAVESLGTPTPMPETGSFQNCSGPVVEHRFFFPELHDHSVVVSCRKIHYKIPPNLKYNRYFWQTDDILPVRLLVGISSSSSSSVERRQAIRLTWGTAKRGIFHNRYFFVGGTDFSAIEREYNHYKDMIWLDMDEESGLTYKTGAMMGIFQKHVKNFEYVFKTDDEAYINIPELYKELSEGHEGYQQEYWGNCSTGKSRPNRPKDSNFLTEYNQQFVINTTVYPENMHPPYCVGAGYIVGPKFLECIAREMPHLRFHPYEDVAIGLVAERCGVPAVPHSEEAAYKWRLNDVGEVNMMGKILQHRVTTPVEMQQLHATAVR